MMAYSKTAFIVALVFSLIFVQSLSSLNFAVAEASKTNISSPIKQIKHKISAESIKCKGSLELVFKATDGLPACVTTKTKDKLEQMGWTLGGGLGATVTHGGVPQIHKFLTGGKFVPNQLIIKFNDNIPDKEHAAKLQGTGAEIVDSIPQIHVRILRVPDQAMAGIMKSLQHIPGVEYVEQDTIYGSDALPNDQYYANQKYLTKINAPVAWDVNTGSSNALVAILDTGFDTTHPDLSAKFVNGYNAYDGSTNITPLSTCAHGTQVAGVAAAISNNNAGVTGMAWANNIIPIKVTGTTSCSASTSALAKGVTYAADKGAKVANISFAIYAGDSTITTAAKYMYGKGGWVVAAAGNSGALVSSADNPYIISVGATDLNDAKASFSTYGPYLDFAAPGTSLYTTTLDGTYTYTSGTSVASPLVAALIGLIWSQSPNLAQDQVYNIIQQSAVDLGGAGRDDYYGWGRIDAGKALQLASGGIITIQPAITLASASTTIPAAPTITSTSTVTNDNTPTIGGTVTAGLAIKVYDSTTQLGSVTVTSTGSWLFTTPTLADGTHTITAKSIDSAGNTSPSSNSITITVDTTAPAAPVITTASDTITTTTPTISGAAETSSTVKVYDSATQLGSVTVTSTGSWSFTTPTLADGSHTITATDRDSVGNTSVASSAVSITVSTSSSSTTSSSTTTTQADTTPPTVSITSPANGATVSGMIKITVSASDSSGVAKIDLYIDAKLVKTLSSSPYSYSYNTKGIANGGTHTISAKAYDTKGNSATASISLKVNKK